MDDTELNRAASQAASSAKPAAGGAAASAGSVSAAGSGMVEGMDDLEAMFGTDDAAAAESEQVVLNQNLEGFASCFPDWDLHPPVGM